ncbi:MAG: hypothetical protein V1755_00375 [Chloroflexota bacterium]
MLLALRAYSTPMKTPAGKECRYFYGNYFRGRNTEECRLLRDSGQRWSRDLCTSCAVPEILRANACEFLRFRAEVARPLSAVLQRRVRVLARCEKTGRDVPEPEIGCGECHPLPPEFVVKD